MSFKQKLQEQYKADLEQVESRFEEMLEDVVGNAVSMNQPLEAIDLTKDKMEEHGFYNGKQVEMLLFQEDIGYQKSVSGGYVMDLSEDK